MEVVSLVRGPRTTRDGCCPPEAVAAASRRAAAVVAAVAAAGLLVAGCISGRVLEGYPGYPFVAFDLPAPADSTFFSLQEELRAEGFELDFTERATGLVNTRPADRPAGRLFLSAVVDSTAEGSRVWIAAYRPVRDGARRVDPLDEDAWADLRGVAARVSDRLGGTAVEEPPPPDGRGR
ncbi:MAG: hypothetical protein ACODAA_07835 [Gemmatimonadota bacterium]